MYLRNLKIHGFKSFANKTTLDFNGGLTCVVGPNGCGKSNIVDAIRWVLGEQRSAILRSEKMDNVIFSGSDSAKPLGMAEVSMTIKNTRNVLPIEYSEVVVTRRLFRSGESEYLLNKSSCRLKDIKDLFLDTGVGPDTYSVIELKMVETILSNKSEERLGLFEEAAGINKYKHRRNAAFRKLDATNVDLNRVVDIISEVERGVNSLKRQVSRAERYESLTHEIEELEIRSASLEYFTLKKKLSPLKEELHHLERSYQQNRSELSRDEADLEKRRVSLLELENDLSKLQGKISHLTESIHQKENFVIATQERLKATEEKVQRYSEEQVQLERRIEVLKQRIEDGEPKLTTLSEKVDGLRIKYRHKEQELSEFEKVLVRRRLEMNESRTRLIELLEVIGEKEKERNRLDSQIFHQKGRIEQIISEIDRLKKNQAKTLVEESELVKEGKILEKEFAKIESLFKEKQEVLKNKQNEIEAIKEKHFKLENRLETLNQQQLFFQNLIEMNEGLSDGIQHILTLAKSNPNVLGLLGDLIDVPKEYRLAVEAILDEKTFYVVVKSNSDAFDLIDKLKEKKLGQVTFLILDRVKDIKKSLKKDLPNISGIICRASDVIQSSKELKPIVDLLFRNFLFVEKTDAFQNLSNNWFAATLTGEVAAPFGLLRSGKYQSEEKISLISRSTQLNEIEKEKSNTQKSIELVEQELKQKLLKTEEIELEVLDLQRNVENSKEKFQQNKIETAQTQTTLANFDNSLSSLSNELEEVENFVAESKEKIKKIKPEIDDLIRKRRRYEDETEIQQEKLEELESQRNQLAEEAHEFNVDLVQTTGDKNGLEVDLKRMQRTLKEVENTVDQRKKEIEESQESIISFNKDIQSTTLDLEKIKQEKDVLLSSQEEQKQEYQKLQDTINRKERLLKESRKEGETSADTLQNLRLNISETGLKIDNLHKHIQDKYRVEITPIESGSKDELENIQTKLDQFREKLRIFGAVNLMALDEYKKESDRLEFLFRQKNDLVEAQDTLLETIQVINKTAHERFETVFNQIRSNFRQNFEDFFEGGEGDLRIRFDLDDPLAANIMILARPRGKQLGALELLSAGEKALTAITLLFSIYQVKPSPFCILDEVDAPLDDVNVRRFLRVLRNFAKDVQFIIVTHNKLTMEAADFIYGVTMAEEGISKIVSVELNKSDDLVLDN